MVKHDYFNPFPLIFNLVLRSCLGTISKLVWCQKNEHVSFFFDWTPPLKNEQEVEFGIIMVHVYMYMDDYLLSWLKQHTIKQYKVYLYASTQMQAALLIGCVSWVYTHRIPMHWTSVILVFNPFLSRLDFFNTDAKLNLKMNKPLWICHLSTPYPLIKHVRF